MLRCLNESNEENSSRASMSPFRPSRPRIASPSESSSRQTNLPDQDLAEP